MTYKTHVAFGASITSIMAIELVQYMQINHKNTFALAFFAGGMIFASVPGSLFPDMDKRQSKIGRKHKFISSVTELTLGHRGTLHQPLFYLVAGSITSIFATNALNKFGIQGLIPATAMGIIIGFLMGCLLHIFADMCTKGGVPLFGPVSKKRISILPIRTSGFSEFVFFISILLLDAYYIYSQFSQYIIV